MKGSGKVRDLDMGDMDVAYCGLSHFRRPGSLSRLTPFFGLILSSCASGFVVVLLRPR